ncbi:AAA ATPase (plasmid) [Oceanithermus profundus DSM 14977]|uniref:AAA ATPase n=1 Tax=Oceanithermus profundus (strain DSM 14977 / NBRC 100410 / VKM B-2274 / 506) TaxID=670487 RepID=E4UAI4_OCEP5|nr:AAA family ATPase [Oceanithermus profundus]ADR37763.1 AAA ATPase [Oceanithermus profundus DSM 14977]
MVSEGRWKIERVVYLKDGFAVVAVRNEAGERHTAVGEMPTPVEGTWVRMETEHTVHPRYGPRLRVVRFLGLAPPPSKELAKIEGYLKLGFSEEAASWLAARFGSRPERAFDKPQELLVPGVPREVLRRVFPRLERLLGGLIDLLGEGHTAAPLFLLAERSGLGKEEIQELAREARKQRLIVEEQGRYGLVQPYRTERSIADGLLFRLKPGRGLRLTPPAGHGLSDEQARIFKLVRENRVVVLTGGPGSGKTTTIATLLAAPELHRMRFGIAAPTGKAARRIAEVARLPAETIHRLLGLGEARRPLYHARNPLPYDLLVIDETSMLDAEIAAFLVDALAPSTSVIFVGDPDQLPPVGPGQFLRDLMTRVATLRLTQIFRQAQDSPIVNGAYALREGRMPLADGERLRLLPFEEEAAQTTLRTLLDELQRLEQIVGERPQVLVPGNRGPLGVRRLSPFLQQQLNPGGKPLGPIGWGMEAREGDPAVWIHNDYELGIMNGEVGVLRGGGSLGLTFETPTDRFAIPGNKRSRLVLAYAMTVHRSQGSEWPAVITILPKAHMALLSRELVYTALTRSKQYHTLLFHPEALYRARAVQASRRYTWLDVLLRG